MNDDILKGKWKQMKGSAQKQWGALTDDELEQVDGDANKLAGLIQEKYGESKETARDAVNSWLKSIKS